MSLKEEDRKKKVEYYKKLVYRTKDGTKVIKSGVYHRSSRSIWPPEGLAYAVGIALALMSVADMILSYFGMMTIYELAFSFLMNSSEGMIYVFIILPSFVLFVIGLSIRMRFRETSFEGRLGFLMLVGVVASLYFLIHIFINASIRDFLRNFGITENWMVVLAIGGFWFIILFYPKMRNYFNRNRT